MPGRGQRHDLAGVPVIVVENVQDYREAAAHYVSERDCCLEVGCAQGCTTSVIARCCKEVVGVDKSPFNAKVAQGRYPDIPFYEMDAMDISGLHRLGKTFTKIFLDISGSQPVGPLATLLEKYERAFPSVDLFVVKSYRLKKLVGLSAVFPEEVLGTTRNATAHYMLRAGQEGGQANGQSHGAGSGREAPGRTGAGARGPWGAVRRLLGSGRVQQACCVVAAFCVGAAVGRRRARR